MYLATIQYRKKLSDELCVITKQFDTKKQACEFTFYELCNTGSKYVTYKSEVCKMG